MEGHHCFNALSLFFRCLRLPSAIITSLLSFVAVDNISKEYSNVLRILTEKSHRQIEL